MKAVLSVAAVLALTLDAASADAPTARVRVTQRDLVPQCLNGQPVASRVREWRIPPGSVSLAFTMRSDPRPGQATMAAGTAAIAFTAEADHRYEIEVRAEPMAFSTRTWRAREWTPVVRDRTTDRIVSGDPQWVASPCQGVGPHAPQASSASSRVTRPSS